MKKALIFLIVLIFGLELYLESLAVQDFYDIPLFFQENYISVAYVMWILRIVCLVILGFIVYKKLKSSKG